MKMLFKCIAKLRLAPMAENLVVDAGVINIT
jgi:hypothetical protein